MGRSQTDPYHTSNTYNRVSGQDRHCLLTEMQCQIKEKCQPNLNMSRPTVIVRNFELPGPDLIKHFSCSTQLSIVGILTL